MTAALCRKSPPALGGRNNYHSPRPLLWADASKLGRIALRRLRSQDKDITLLITESSPKLLDTFADVTLTIERGEIESRAGN
jgi:hypothetical protein